MPVSKGREFFVDGTRGSNAGPGTLKRPWKTISHALRRVPLAGSVIQVRGGTYVEMVRFERRADPRNPVTLRPFPGERVELTAPPNSDLHAVWIRGARGLRVTGFAITSPTSNVGVKIENSEDIEIAGCEIHHTGRSGILIAGTGTTPPTGNRNVQIWNNRFHDNGGNAALESAGNRIGGHSLYWGAVSSNTDGIDHTTYGGVIANNLFYNQPNGYHLQIGSEASGLIVTNNTFYRSTRPSPGGTAIMLYTETQSRQWATRDVLVVNNIISYAVSRGVYGSGGGGVMATNLVRNNLAYGNAQGDFLPYYGSTSNVLFTLGENLTGVMPLFVAPGRFDFRLQRKSPAIDKADVALAPATDAAGNARVGNPDLGAFERVPVRR